MATNGKGKWPFRPAWLTNKYRNATHALYYRTVPASSDVSGVWREFAFGVPDVRDSDGSASGTSVVSGESAAVLSTVGDSLGTGAMSGASGAVVAAGGASSGSSVVVGVSGAVRGVVGAIVGGATVIGISGGTQAVVGTASGGGSVLGVGENAADVSPNPLPGTIIEAVGASVGVSWIFFLIVDAVFDAIPTPPVAFGGAVLGDVAGGPVVSVVQNWGFWNNRAILCVGDPVIPHGDSPHNAAVMVTGSPWFTINGIPVCRTGDLASCGDVLAGSQGWTIVD